MCGQRISGSPRALRVCYPVAIVADHGVSCSRTIACESHMWGRGSASRFVAQSTGGPVVYVVSDVLHVSGMDIQSKPLDERLTLLPELEGAPDAILFSLAFAFVASCALLSRRYPVDGGGGGGLCA